MADFGSANKLKSKVSTGIVEKGKILRETSFYFHVEGKDEYPERVPIEIKPLRTLTLSSGGIIHTAPIERGLYPVE